MIEDDVRKAIDASHLRILPPDVITGLTVEARRVRFPAGARVQLEGEMEPHLDLVISGLLRAYVSAPDGRALTVRYCRWGALMGVATLYADVEDRPFAVQALSDSELLRLRPPIVRRLADRDARLAGALLAETSERVLSFVAELSGNAFSTVRQRLARHLLDLASERQHGPDLVASLRQQDLADAIGTAREVVVRALRELRAEGIVSTGRHGITIHDPERLFGSADALERNKGS